MRADVLRRLGALEANTRTRRPKPLTDRDHDLFASLTATAVALHWGRFTPGDDPFHALYTGMEAALFRGDTTKSRRASFAQRLDYAAWRAVSGMDSDHCPQGLFQTIAGWLDRPGARELVAAFIGIRRTHPSFHAPERNHETVIDADGVERYAWPGLAGADRPAATWIGQGFEAAKAYWADAQSAIDRRDAPKSGEVASPASGQPHHAAHRLAP